jgi:hypothetical protein
MDTGFISDLPTWRGFSRLIFSLWTACEQQGVGWLSRQSNGAEGPLLTPERSLGLPNSGRWGGENRTSHRDVFLRLAPQGILGPA